MALTNRNHQLIAAHFTNTELSKSVAIDATCGNGHDTLFLSKLGFDHVYAFDLQQQAIDNTRQRLKQENLDNTTFICASHDTMKEVFDLQCTMKVDCIMFNLGYLPSADKNITTKEETSVQALEQSLELLNKDGLLSILCYPGHPEGARETKAIQSWLQSIDKIWSVIEVLSSHPSPKSPILYMIQ